MALPVWLKQPSTFRARIFWSVIPIIVLLVVIHGIMMVWEHRRLVTEEFIKRGQAMTRNLAQSSELAVFAEDEKLLESSIRGVAGDPDVAYVSIYGEDGRLLARGGRGISGSAESFLQLSAQEKARFVPGIQASSKRLADERGEFIEFFAPIFSQGGGTPSVFAGSYTCCGQSDHPTRSLHQRLCPSVGPSLGPYQNCEPRC